MAILDKDAIVGLYRRRAARYDITANLYYLMGFREFAYRRRAVDALSLRPGDTVVEVGCGTGLNFALLQARTGPDGRIIGVDMTDGMLEKAGERVSENGWQNVELVREDAAKYVFPKNVDGIISTFAITLVPEFDEVIRNGSDALAPGGRFVILDFKMPRTRVSALAPVMAFLTKPFGVSIEMAGRHPWESVENYLEKSSIDEYYGGFVYIASGEKAGA